MKPHSLFPIPPTKPLTSSRKFSLHSTFPELQKKIIFYPLNFYNANIRRLRVTEMLVKNAGASNPKTGNPGSIFQSLGDN